MEKFTELYDDIDILELIGSQVVDHNKFLQSSDFFHLAYKKSARFSALKAQFFDRGISKLYVGSSIFGNIDINDTGIETYFLPVELFDEDSAGIRQYMQERLAGSLVILCNNELGSPERRLHFAEFYGKCSSTIFMIWDWDNHHNLETSLFLAAYSDIYFPAHNENLYILSRINSMVCRVPCAIMQWPRSKLRNHFLNSPHGSRQVEPLGMHVYYEHFIFRNQAIVTLQRKYKAIGFADKTYLSRSNDDRLTEWCSYKSHWIIPVLNDVPIRLFDALGTGGIPIVPNSLRFMSPVDEIPVDDIVFYGPDDLLNPEMIVARANALFDSGGDAGVISRHRLALDRHHIDNRVEVIINAAQKLMGFCLNPRGPASSPG